MRLYRVTTYDPHEGCCFEWFAKAKDAKERQVEHTMEGHNAGCETIDIPNSARDLADWLNHYLNRDNG